MSLALNHYHMHCSNLCPRRARTNTCGLSLASRSNADKPGFPRLSANHLFHCSIPVWTGMGSESLTPNLVGNGLINSGPASPLSSRSHFYNHLHQFLLLFIKLISSLCFYAARDGSQTLVHVSYCFETVSCSPVACVPKDDLELLTPPPQPSKCFLSTNSVA